MHCLESFLPHLHYIFLKSFVIFLIFYIIFRCNYYCLNSFVFYIGIYNSQ